MPPTDGRSGTPSHSSTGLDAELDEADGHRRDGDTERAEAGYFRVLRACGRFGSGGPAAGGRVRIGLGRLELARGDPERALAWFLGAREVDPSVWEPLYWQGCALGWLGDHAAALDMFTRCRDLAGREPSVLVQRAVARLRLGDDANALDDLREALDANPSETATRDLLLRLARDRVAARDHSGAEPFLVECVERGVGVPEVEGVLAEIRRRTGTVGDRDGVSRLTISIAHDTDAVRSVCAAWLRDDGVPEDCGMAATAALLHDDAFWTRFGADAAHRYGQPVAADALASCRALVEERAHARAGRSAMLVRELAAAEAVHEGGHTGDDQGLPPAWGPLLVTITGRARWWSEMVAAGTAGDGPGEHWDTVRVLFSGLGGAAALLRAGRPEEALVAIHDAACPGCRRHPAPPDRPQVCDADCPDVDRLHVGYAALPDRTRRLADDAAHLWVDASLDAAARAVAAARGGHREPLRLWADAIRTADAVGTGDPTRRRVADTVMGREKTLAGSGRTDEAVALLESAEKVLRRSALRDEITTRLADVLCDRGIRSANDGRSDPALADLRRALAVAPHASRPRINLSIVLQNRAEEFGALGHTTAERAAACEAWTVVADPSSTSGGADLDRQRGAAADRLRSVCLRQGAELAAESRYADAVAALDDGLCALPGDPELERSRRGVELGRERVGG